MKRVIRSASSVYAMVSPVVDEIIHLYEETTGFECRLGKWYYRQDIDAVLLEFTQNYCRGIGSLSQYNAPGRAKANDPAMIHLDASDSDIQLFVDRLVQVLIDSYIQYSFNPKRLGRPEYTVREYGDNPESNEYRINMIINESQTFDDDIARRFLEELLDSGEVVNRLTSDMFYQK